MCSFGDVRRKLLASFGTRNDAMLKRISGLAKTQSILCLLIVIAAVFF
jgi:hypothetical protein